MLTQEDRLRIYAAVQATFGNTDLADVVCSLAETQGVEQALLSLNKALWELACMRPDDWEDGDAS